MTYRVPQAIWIAYGHYPVSYLHQIGVTEFQGLEVLCLFYLYKGNISLRVTANYFCIKNAFILKGHLDLVSHLDNMVIGKYISILIYNKTCSQSALRYISGHTITIESFKEIP